MDDYIQIDITVNSKEQSDMLIAELSDAGFESFEEKETMLCAFVKKNNYDEVLLKQILSSYNIVFSKYIIPQINWNQKWESEYPPVIVDDAVAIRASFHPQIDTVKDEILITPKMSFGTGHHATTFLMLQQMAKVSFKNKCVLDFGTGTGVLAIYASKLGAARVIAIDNDDWSIENAKENILKNACNIELYKSDTPDIAKNFDVILANINLNVIKNNIATLNKISKTSFQIIVSGVLKTDEKNLIGEFEKQHMNVINITEKDGWICIWLSN